MCGIVAYLGFDNAYPILINGLRRLEYRGYDSSGVALYNDGIQIFKKQGKVSDLTDSIGVEKPSASIGIGHTRWATHGEPNDKKCPPSLLR